MGQRISYFKNNFDKGLKDLIIENFNSFQNWYFDFYNEKNYDIKEDYLNDINEHLESYFRKESIFLIDNLEKKLVDELTSEFIGNFCDISDRQNNILEYFGPMFNKWRYVESTKMVVETNDNDFIELWSYITKGRSLKDGLNFDSFTNEYKIGFLDRQEYLNLKSKIEYHFGNDKTIRNKYWTNKEKEQFEKAINDKSFILTGHNPKTSGIEFVLCALNELTDKNKELITGIE